MPSVARVGDPFTCGDFVAQGSTNVFINSLPCAYDTAETTGHGCFNANHVVAKHASVFVNGKPIAIVGDSNEPHRCDGDPHTGTISQGSPDVIA